MLKVSNLQMGKIVHGDANKPPQRLKIKHKEPVSFDEFVLKKLQSGELTAQLAFYLRNLLDEWKKENDKCFKLWGGEE